LGHSVKKIFQWNCFIYQSQTILFINKYTKIYNDIKLVQRIAQKQRFLGLLKHGFQGLGWQKTRTSALDSPDGPKSVNWRRYIPFFLGMPESSPLVLSNSMPGGRELGSTTIESA